MAGGPGGEQSDLENMIYKFSKFQISNPNKTVVNPGGFWNTRIYTPTVGDCRWFRQSPVSTQILSLNQAGPTSLEFSGFKIIVVSQNWGSFRCWCKNLL